jgi:hypothetical protein
MSSDILGIDATTGVATSGSLLPGLLLKTREDGGGRDQKPKVLAMSQIRIQFHRSACFAKVLEALVRKRFIAWSEQSRRKYVLETRRRRRRSRASNQPR